MSAQAQNMIAQDSTQALLNTEPISKELSVIELIQSGGVGGQIIIALLFILSLIAIYIFVERYLAIRKEQKRDENFLLTIKDFIQDEKFDAAKELCERTDTLVARVYRGGLNHIHRNESELALRLEKIANQEIHKMESKLPTLATISGAAPMMGFLGTVIGMIVVFHNIATAGGKIELELLSNGIYTAMTTTVAGLMVGIIAYIAYNNLVSRMSKVAFNLETYCDEFSDILIKKD
ncbi:MAG: MotA/TolQ/ExbB proton channel family protein [Flavobacteriales bacterium]